MLSYFEKRVFFNTFKQNIKCMNNIARKAVPAPLPPFLRHSPLAQLVPFLKSLFLLHSFLFHPLLRCFRYSFHRNVSPYCSPPTSQTYFQKGDFTSSTVSFYQKSIFNLLYPFTNRFLWDIFRFIFRQLKMTFFHKIIVAEKNNSSSNA